MRRDDEEVGRQTEQPGVGTPRRAPEGADPEEQNPAVLVGADIHQQNRLPQKRVGLGEELSRSDMAQDRPVAPQVVASDRDASLQHEPHAVRRLPGVKDGLPLFVAAVVRLEDAHGRLNLVLAHALENRRLAQLQPARIQRNHHSLSISDDGRSL